MEFHLTWNNKKYICDQFYDTQSFCDGIDLYEINENGNQLLLCDILDITIPDAQDELSCKEFINTIGLFLTDYYDGEPKVK